MTAREVQEVRPLGGLTREEALKVYDAGRFQGATTEVLFKEVNEIGRRTAHELGLLERAEDYPGIVKYVQEVWDVDDLALSLENVLDDLDRGMTDVCEGYSDWLKERKKAKKQLKRDLILLAEAGDARIEELQDEIENGNLPRRDISRMQRDLKALHGAVYRLWERIQK